jgi:hypothetical protein
MRPFLAIVHSSPVQPEAPLSTRGQRVFRVAALVTLLLATAFGLVLHSCSERMAVERMSVPERHALLDRTMKNLSTVCEAPADGLRDWCRGQAELAVECPECGESCKSLAARQLSRVQAPR